MSEPAYISERIGLKLAADKDRMIRSELAKLIGREVDNDEIVRRVTVQHTTSGAETYFLDGDPFLRFASPHIEIDDSSGRRILTARQDVLRIEQRRTDQTQERGASDAD